MTRKEYLDSPYPRDAAHRRYYAQYVTPRIQGMVRHLMPRVMRSTDEHFNDIPLREWDACYALVPADVNRMMRENGDAPTAAGMTCLLKEAARQLREEAEATTV